MATKYRGAYAAGVVSNRTVRGVQLVIIEEGTPVSRPAGARPRWAVAVIAAVAILAIAMGAVAGAFLVGGRNAFTASAGPDFRNRNPSAGGKVVDLDEDDFKREPNQNSPWSGKRLGD